MSSIISVENLKKNYGKVEAVKGIDFFVESGKLFAFLGPNGAGKSTTIDVLCTLLTPDAGAVIIDNHILGKHNDAIRKKIGIVFQDSLLDPLLTVRENLITRARFYGLSGSSLKNAVNTAAITADITDFLDRPYGKLSGGQRRRTDIARALLNTPKILFLDEPTTGLDPKSKDSLWNTIKTLQKDTGMTIFLTTHYMEEAAAADYIIIL
ncbi:MAG: ATP-binding cassette domain-containing protein, partial [Clostridiales bacterium]|nr:ATP-binding cassette domain-containing protein [Clostridiales bacterium]